MALPDVADITTTLRNAFAPAIIPEPPTYLVGKAQNESPLFALPAELRLRIYSYSFTQSHDNHACHLKQGSSTMVNIDQVEQTKPSTSLLVTCRQIYTEAKGISSQAERDFWRDNTFFIELRKDWAATGEPKFDFSSILRCQINSIQRLVVFVDTGSNKWTFNFKKDPASGSLSLDLEEITADPRDVMTYATALRAVQSRKVKQHMKLNSQINMLERYNYQAAAYLDIATRMREMTSQEQTFVTALMAKLKPWVQQHTSTSWESILNPNRAQLEVLLKVLYKKYKVQRNPGLFVDQ